MNLYLITTDGLGQFYVLANDPSHAEAKVVAHLTAEDFGAHPSLREATNVERIAKERAAGNHGKLIP